MAHVAHRAIAGLAAALAAGGTLAGCAGSAEQPAPRRTAATTPAPAVLPGPAAQRAAVQRLARLGRPIYCGAGTRRLVALTFDDGPARDTPIVLRQLHDAGARATFFLVGKSIDGFPQTPRLQREHHAIGDHSMTHANLRTLSPAAATAEIAAGKAKALEAAGEPVDLFRPPYGSRTQAIDREVSRQGMAQILWDVDSTDSRNTPPARFREIAARVREHAKPGSIVLMHDEPQPDDPRAARDPARAQAPPSQARDGPRAARRRPAVGGAARQGRQGLQGRPGRATALTREVRQQGLRARRGRAGSGARRSRARPLPTRARRGRPPRRARLRAPRRRPRTPAARSSRGHRDSCAAGRASGGRPPPSRGGGS